jgi:serine/threonine protein kinase
MSTSEDEPLVRRLKFVGGYELFSPLAAGGMGTVFKAREIETGEIVALKVLTPSAARNPTTVERFDREAKIACSLSHPNIVEGIASGSVKNLHFYAMELVVGESIADMLKRKGRLDSDWTLRVMWDVAQGLHGAHQAGLVHRDVKPHNLMIDREGVVKLCDLGLARSQDDGAVADTSKPEGTPFYMSPEQVTCDRPIDARTDIYSLGATGYHMVTGSPPFRAETRAKVMQMHVTTEPIGVLIRNPSVNVHLAAVIEKCLRKDPADRYQSMEELASDLHEIEEGNVPEAVSEPQAKMRRRPRTRTRLGLRRRTGRRITAQVAPPVVDAAREAETKLDAERPSTPPPMRRKRSSRRVAPAKSADAMSADVEAAAQGDGPPPATGRTPDKTDGPPPASDATPKPSRAKAATPRPAGSEGKAEEREPEARPSDDAKKKLPSQVAEKPESRPSDIPPMSGPPSQGVGVAKAATPRPKKPNGRRSPSPRVASPVARKTVELSQPVMIAIVVGVVVVAGASLWWFLTRSGSPKNGVRTKEASVENGEDGARAASARALDELSRRALDLAASGDYDAALAVFADLPPELDESARVECESRREAVRTTADGELSQSLTGAERAIDAGDLDGAVAILDQAEQMKYAAAKPRIEQMRGRLADARAKEAEEERRRAAEAEASARARLSNARVRLAEFIKDFDRALTTIGPHGADQLVTAALDSEELSGLKPELMTLMSVSKHIARLRELEADIDDRLARRRTPVTMEYEDGSSVSGTVTSVRRTGRELMFIMEVEAGGKRRTTVCYAKQLKPASRTALLLPGTAKSPDERIARAFLAMLWRDVTTARAMLDGTTDHLLYPYYKGKLRKLEARLSGR